MQVYFNEQGVLIIDGYGTTINYDPSKITLGDVQSLKKEFRNFVFTPKLEPVDRTIGRIRVKNRPRFLDQGLSHPPLETFYPMQVTINDEDEPLNPKHVNKPGDILSIYTTKRLIAALMDAVKYAEAERNERINSES